MRDMIKQICIDYIRTGKVPEGCELKGWSGGFGIYNKDDCWANWEATGSSACWDKMHYKIYNSFFPDQIDEQGLLIVNTYNCSKERCSHWNKCDRHSRY